MTSDCEAWLDVGMTSTTDSNIPTATTASTWIVGSMTSALNLPTSERIERPGLHRINGSKPVVHTEPFTLHAVLIRSSDGTETRRMYETFRTLRGAKIAANKFARTHKRPRLVAFEVTAEIDGTETVLYRTEA